MLENSDSKGSFSQNTLKSFLSDWDLFWPRSFEFKVSNHCFIELWWIWLRETVKNQDWRAFCLRYPLNPSFSLLSLIFVLAYFIDYFYTYACLFWLVLKFFLCFELVWLFEIGFSFLLCFSASLFLGWDFEQPCKYMP